VFDGDGRIRGSADREIAQHYPASGHVEHDADEIFATTVAVGREALAAAGVTGRDVAAIGITNQRETTLLWDRRTGKPIHHAIVWQDRRTAAHCDRLKAEGREPAIRERTGLVLDAYFSATKARWLLDHVKGAEGRAARGELCFGTIDTALLWKLTGGALHVTDVSNAFVIVNKTSGTFRYGFAAGAYNIPVVGFALNKTTQTGANTSLYGAVPSIYLEYAPTGRFNLQAGKLATFIGQESTYTYENPNIQRGIIWNMETAVSRGLRANFSGSKFNGALEVNDGFYSGNRLGVEGQITNTPSASTALEFVFVIPNASAPGNTTASIANKRLPKRSSWMGRRLPKAPSANTTTARTADARGRAGKAAGPRAARRAHVPRSARRRPPRAGRSRLPSRRASSREGS